MSSQKVLLLNASNMDKFPVYPYAFIQVPAVARQVGIKVICKDLMGIPHEKWKQTIQTLIERHNPAMILITLRNIDSGTSKDYERDSSNGGDKSAYFPIERTKELIVIIRAISNLKIAVGGFGFSLLANDIMHKLHPDFGVFGGPNAFFSHFEDVKSGNLSMVANLLYFQENQLISNPRIFYPPHADTEYTAETIKAMMEFYTSFTSPGFEGAPVEIMRGCSHSCVFCAEPHSLGTKVRYRDLTTVMKDIEILVENGITKIYLISSELNPEGNEFILELAERIWTFNERQTEDRKITWDGANYLLKFGTSEYEQLYKSGFTGGWFDITALDDKNARAMRTPYRNDSLLAHVKTYAECKRKQLDLLRVKTELQPELMTCAGDNKVIDEPITWTMFLGNPATTIETIRNTLQVANREGLPSLFDECGINDNIRVFDYEDLTESTLAVTYSVSFDLKRTNYRQVLPSFAYPPALLQDFGSEEEITLMFDHISKTYLSTKYQETRDWHGFVKKRSTVASISRWIAKLSDIKGVYIPNYLKLILGRQGISVLKELFTERRQEAGKKSDESLAKQVVDFLVLVCLDAFPGFFESLHLPRTTDELDRMTSYDLAVAVFSKWSTEKKFVDELMVLTQSVSPAWKRDLLQFCAQAILYRFNIQIRQKYRQLFISVGTIESELNIKLKGTY
ncbi:MAG: radical SAM protein [Candidatus Marinimicrobia bacterium]|nr:radical SAM protein [Candidatus Neomarinimicrobiota bacterium]